MRSSLLLRLAAASALLPGLSALALDYPPTPRHPVTDSFFGTQVTEDYRWLENGDDPAVKAWGEAQMKLTRATLDALAVRPALGRELKELYSTSPVRYFDMQYRKRFFAMKRQPPKNQPMLVVMGFAGHRRGERVLLDPNALDAGGTTSIDWYAASLDGKYVAVSLSKNGSEDGSAHVIDVATGKEQGDVVPRVNWPTGGGSIAWDAEGAGFFYTRYPQGNERAPQDMNFYQQVYYHKLGTPPSSDTYAIGKEFPRIAETALSSTRDGKYLLASVANGDGGEFSYYLRDASGKWAKFASESDKIRRVELGLDGNLYALSLDGAPRGKVLAMPLGAPDLAKARVVIPEGKATIEDIAPTATRLYAGYMVGGPSEIRVFDLEGKLLATLPTEPVSNNALGERLDNDEVLVRSESFLHSTAWYRYDPRPGRLVQIGLAEPSKVSFDDAEVVREMAKSRDGTRVPVNLVMKKGTKRDGSHPLLLYGYGGYGVSERPHFSLWARAWLDHGGIYATVNLRGGGEFGEAWHKEGNLTRKQNVFDDMIGAAEHVIERGYTKPARLAAVGGSNGGLLMGAILTQRPDLFRAVWSLVGIYDMLRVELTPNGAFNVTEFGTVKDEAQFRALYGYSPYHHVKDGTAYPAVLFSTGENDGRVDPYNSRKMAARLQAADPHGHPILLRTSADTGHGIDTSLEKRVAEDADGLAFLMSELGM
ncbi:MAG TPA: prolyl oligopeptidase family serine peptidase [Usitatibacter sp.]|nr:prolyl oligopeptidase family serine peptidase [Usitatibacter sp.]